MLHFHRYGAIISRMSFDAMNLRCVRLNRGNRKITRGLRRLSMQNLICCALAAFHGAMNCSPVPCCIRVFASEE